MSSIKLGICITAAVFAAVMTCYFVLLRWQARVISRERGEQPQGFPVQPPRE